MKMVPREGCRYKQDLELGQRQALRDTVEQQLT